MDLGWWFTECYNTAFTPCGHEFVIEVVGVTVIIIILGVWSFYRFKAEKEAFEEKVLQ